jgi:hypothetical protein
VLGPLFFFDALMPDAIIPPLVIASTPKDPCTPTASLTPEDKYC